MYKNKTNRFTPLFMAICVVIGILIGTFYANHFSGNRLNIINTSGNKLNNLLHEYGSYIVGRMGMPYQKKNLSIISVIVDAPETVISNLAGKLGMLSGVSVKATYSKK